MPPRSARRVGIPGAQRMSTRCVLHVSILGRVDERLGGVQSTLALEQSQREAGEQWHDRRPEQSAVISSHSPAVLGEA
jgi:hypothetical protein